jgi:hypothetical protein
MNRILAAALPLGATVAVAVVGGLASGGGSARLARSVPTAAIRAAVGYEVAQTPPAQETPPATPSPGPAPAEVAPAPLQQLAAKDIEAERVRARVIYAKRVEARGGHVAAIVEDRESTLWQDGPPIEGHVTAVEIDTDVIYAERVKAAWIEADRVYAQEVRIGK